jgi:uncharacterized protein with von Willebrand factor type A (vWA) domain
VVAAVVAFADELRAGGVDLPTSAVLDALGALTHVDVTSREETRLALATTLVKRAEDLGVFDATFDRWFAALPPSATDPVTESVEDQPIPSPEGAEALRDRLADALAGGDAAGLRLLAARAVRRWAGIDQPVAQGDRYHLQRVLRGLDLSAVGHEARRRARAGQAQKDALQDRLTRTEIEALLGRFRRMLADEVRAQRAPEDGWRRGRLDEVEFLRASTQELRAMRAAVRPLARRLAARVARQERHRARHGRLDMRRTLRHSLQSGGVPLDPAYRHRPRTRPELWLLCDVSGSVAEFSRFTLAFVYALHEELAGLRTFVFVDDVDEITDLLDRRLHDVDPFGLLVRASASRSHHRSDYGRMFRQFVDAYGRELTPRATLMITGDARSHHLDPGLDALRTLAHRARRVWFLNPEPQHRWDQGDSVASLYGLCCDRMAEVRNLAQLGDCVSQLL